MGQHSNFERLMVSRNHFKNKATLRNRMNNRNQLNRMKKIIFLFSFCFSIIQLFAQNDMKNLIGTHGAFGTGIYGAPGAIGGGAYKVNYYYAFGLDYSRHLFKHWDLCSGVEYAYTKMTVTPAPTGAERPPENTNLTFITIPALFKRHTEKVVSFKGGMLFNILSKSGDEAWIQSRNKEYKPTRDVAMLLGIELGIGFEHKFDSNVTLSLNPYVRWNGIGSVGNFLSSPQINGYRFLQGGIRIGVGYRF